VKLSSFNIHWKFISAIFCLLVFAAGCAPPPRGGMPLETIKQEMESSAAPEVEESAPLPPAEVRSALIPPTLETPMAGSFNDDQRFDIAATQIPARQFFMSLVEGSPVSMVVHPDVAGEISINLKNTTIAEALEVIHNVYGYPYLQTGSIYQIMPVGLQVRTFQVNYLNLVREGISRTRVSSGQVSQSDNSDDNGNDNDYDNNNGNNRGGYVSGSLINTTSTADFWGELREAIISLVGHEGGRKVVIQPQASVIVVIAMPDELQLVEKYLQTIQGNLQRQVVIEAKVVEVSLADGFQTGINWAALAEPGDGKALFKQSGGGTIFSNGTAEDSGHGGNLDPINLLPNGLDPLAFGGVFSVALKFNDFRAFLEMLETQGDVQVLSSPRISTINNQKAVIKVGSDEFFVTDISSDTNTGTTTNTTSDITLTPFFSGISLDVTPQIDRYGGITLHIHPTVSEVVDQVKQINAFGVSQSIPTAHSTVRETDSVVYANSGQLVVIGGLMQEKTIKEEAGVPVLGKLPVVGALFRHTKSSSLKSELVILLRPQVINSPADWERMLESSRQRIEKISPEFQNNWRQF
jgi:MSHA biogenesis protein MshL